MARTPLDADQIQQLEATIFAAGNYVVPTDDLRPQTLDQARQSGRIQKLANRLAVSVVSLMLVWALAMPFLNGLEGYRDSLRGPLPSEIERTAQVYESERHYEPGWGMVDAFQDARRLNTSNLPANSSVQ